MPDARLCGYAHGHWFHTMRGKNGWPATASAFGVTTAPTHNGIASVVTVPAATAR